MFADGYEEGSQVSIRPFAKGSLLSDVTEQLGLVNAWTGQATRTTAWPRPTSRA